MRFSVAKSGWVVLVHHLETVVWLTPNCSASHLLVLFFFTNTNFNWFKSSTVFQFIALDANLVIFFEQATIQNQLFYWDMWIVGDKTSKVGSR